MILVYAASLVPMLLITLVVHELGHLWTSRLVRVKPSRFQIGVGWRIATWYSGRTRYDLTAGTKTLPALEEGKLLPGNLVTIYATRRKGQNHYAAGAVIRHSRNPRADRAQEQLQGLAGTHMRFTGRIREVHPSHLAVADMAWSLRAIPLAAGVVFPDDPSGTMPEAYNVTRWRRKTAITTAGAAANILMVAVILVTVAILPLGQDQARLWEVTRVEPSGAASRAGIMAGDQLVRASNTIYPTPEEIEEKTRRSAETGRTLSLGVARTGEILDLRIGPEAGKLGMEIEPRRGLAGGSGPDPKASGSRIINVTGSYSSAVGSTVRKLLDGDERNDMISGPVAGIYQTANAVERAGVRGWLVVLATLNLTVAATSMVPLPPQDGYRIVAESIQALRKGKPMNPRIERATLVGGISIIAGITAYLITMDILRMVG